MKLGIFKNKNYVSLIVVFFLLVYFIIQLFGLRGFYSYGWDESVYMHMSDYIQSGGEIGLMETGRPVIFPIILIPFSQSIFLLRLFILVLSIVTLWIFYLIGKKCLNSKLSWIFPVALSVFPFYYITSNSVLSEIPTLLFHGLCVYYFLERKYVFSGIFGFLTFFTRFQFGIYLPVLFIAIFFFEKRKELFKYLLRFVSGVLIASSLLLFHVYFFYREAGNFFLAIIYPMINQLKESLFGYVWFYRQSLLYYPEYLFNWSLFSVFIIIGIGFLVYYFIKLRSVKKKNQNDLAKKNILLAFLMLVPLSYLLISPQKVFRFLMLNIPWIVYLMCFGLIETINLIKNRLKNRTLYLAIVSIILILFFVPMLVNSVNRINEFHYAPKEFYNEYLFALQDLPSDIKVITTFPMIKTKSRIDIGYYKRGLALYEKLNENQYDYVYYSDHWLLCQEGDAFCFEFRETMKKYLYDNYNLYMNYSLYGSDFLLYSKV